MNFSHSLTEKLPGCGLRVAIAVAVLGLSIPSAYAVNCGQPAGDADDFPVANTFGGSMGAAVGSVVGATTAINSAILGQGSTAFVSAPANPSPDQEGGGIWTRAVGGSVTTSHDLSLVVHDVPGNAAEVDTNVNCTLKLRQNFAGAQVGTDFAHLNLGGGGGNVHFGLTSGYAALQTSDVNGGFNANFQVPYLGLYSVYTNGNFFVDAQVRADFYQNRITDISAGMNNQKFDATARSVAANMGYHFDLGSNWFIEPSAGVLWSHTDVDDINATGSLLLNGPGTTSINVLPATLHVGAIESTLGRLSARIGTSVSAGPVLFTPFVTGSYYREFGSRSLSSSLFETSNLAPNPGSTTGATPGSACAAYFAQLQGADSCEYSVALNTTRPQYFGQVSVGTNFAFANTGWLGFVRGDYRTGPDINGYAVSGGLRFQYTPEGLVRALAMATKAPYTKAPILAAQPYDWTGFYLGGFVGALTGDTGWAYQGVTNLTLANPFTSVHSSGAIGGVTLGYNKQFGRVVAGFEGDVGWANAKGGRSVPCSAGFLFNCETSMDWMSTVTGRLGYTFGRLLVYSKGGLAVANVSASSIWNPGIIPLNALAGAQPTPAALAFRGSNTAAGWTLGGGFEFALAQNWSSKAEAMYYDLGSATYQLDAPVRISRTGMIGRVGVNYHFN